MWVQFLNHNSFSLNHLLLSLLQNVGAVPNLNSFSLDHWIQYLFSKNYVHCNQWIHLQFNEIIWRSRTPFVWSVSFFKKPINKWFFLMMIDFFFCKHDLKRQIVSYQISFMSIETFIKGSKQNKMYNNYLVKIEIVFHNFNLFFNVLEWSRHLFFVICTCTLLVTFQNNFCHIISIWEKNSKKSPKIMSFFIGWGYFK